MVIDQPWPRKSLSLRHKDLFVKARVAAPLAGSDGSANVAGRRTWKDQGGWGGLDPASTMDHVGWTPRTHPNTIITAGLASGIWTIHYWRCNFWAGWFNSHRYFPWCCESAKSAAMRHRSSLLICEKSSISIKTHPFNGWRCLQSILEQLLCQQPWLDLETSVEIWARGKPVDPCKTDTVMVQVCGLRVTCGDVLVSGLLNRFNPVRISVGYMSYVHSSLLGSTTLKDHRSAMIDGLGQES